ncbi:PPPDE peptidase, putative [Plasmodium ovale]|uniref:PPPDE peptidase, putative n=1 Tax=Plasmodium ovale TaxID=36330 RepID=A0A1D3TGG8_PLAOA|nr:PPPDE peptidase, putative [Plasmodium ovale]
MKKKIRINSRECIGKEKKENAPQKENAAQQKENREHDEIPQPDFNSSMVYLNIYDLDAVSKVVNTVARSVGAGAFHAGVEVYGYEYSFGYIVDGETGVTKTSARYHPYHVYRESIPMEEVDMLVEVMKLQWIGDTYDILSRNCLNYADYFCNLLDVGSIPDWVMSLQKKVTWVKSNINVAASKLKELNKASGIPTVINFLKKKYNENNEEYEGCKVVSKS